MCFKGISGYSTGQVFKFYIFLSTWEVLDSYIDLYKFLEHIIRSYYTKFSNIKQNVLKPNWKMSRHAPGVFFVLLYLIRHSKCMKMFMFEISKNVYGFLNLKCKAFKKVNSHYSK